MWIFWAIWARWLEPFPAYFLELSICGTSCTNQNGQVHWQLELAHLTTPQKSSISIVRSACFFQRYYSSSGIFIHQKPDSTTIRNLKGPQNKVSKKETIDHPVRRPFLNIEEVLELPIPAMQFFWFHIWHTEWKEPKLNFLIIWSNCV